MAKQVKAGVDRISARLSSPMIVDQYEYQNKNPLGLVKNYLKTHFVLNQCESQFIDFNRKKFPVFAKDRYFSLLHSYKRKDKVELMKLLSVPLYDMFKLSIKDNTLLPYKLYDQITDVRIIQARMYNKGNLGQNPAESWHQLTLQFKYIDQQNKDVIKHNVFERREIDSSDKDWRICYLE